jgi:beta-phosphoglucomutase-like phosphatase (HAD superfamily)
VNAQVCWAFEDSPAGVQSARSAGCVVHVLPPSHLSREQRGDLYPGVNRFLSSLREVLEQID